MMGPRIANNLEQNPITAERDFRVNEFKQNSEKKKKIEFPTTY